jgi:hypothetical protein
MVRHPRRSNRRAIASERGRLPAGLDGGEKGAGSGLAAPAGRHGPFACERLRDGRHLGLVNAGPLRGDLALHHPTGGRSLQGRSALAAPPPCRVAPDRQEMASCDTRCPERSGLGRSLGREQSRPGVSGIGFARPLTLGSSGGCLERKATSGRAMAVVPTAVSAGRDVRVVRGRARGDIHLQKS